ncbi:hypothetical protein GGE35_001124 [Rhizobium cellulosilyticum]|uniref:Propionyl-coenzyme A carboxylase alpha polypeptide n=1 Tax=Aliirhizobium cellulosilyticum TaxID=393664 RepID=A0A7W6Y106_9HYPH|nr:hypothetical protein [Rhizobium cellulosilyticum]MBB4410654.1 hypothetical protein [Rhizobium cellulosilyticum]MBB4445342.1 hypothetical protein [Rhizobium cellulosilyticum]
MEWRVKAQPISPLVGEMPGRAEGGKVRGKNTIGSIIYLTGAAP